MEVDEETEAESKERDKKDDKGEKSEAKENNIAIPGLPSGNGKPSKISIIKYVRNVNQGNAVNEPEQLDQPIDFKTLYDKLDKEHKSFQQRKLTHSGAYISYQKIMDALEKKIIPQFNKDDWVRVEKPETQVGLKRKFRRDLWSEPVQTSKRY
jgi:hypothetical protein